jgi:toxin YoeB
MRQVKFDKVAYQDYIEWTKSNEKIALKIKELIKDIQLSPFKGIGKPEPLRHEWQGYWSRRITDEHRLVYKITDNEIIVASCKFHYR